MKVRKKLFKWEIELNNFIENKKDYRLDSHPKKAIDKVSITHLECGRTFSTQARKINTTTCPCSRDYRPNKKTHEFFVKEIKDIYDEEYTVVGKYKNAQTPIAVKHNICNKTYDISPNSILTNNGCSHCYGKERLTHEEFLSMVENLTSEEYTILSRYELSREKVKIRHNTCGHEYYVLPNKFTSGRRCPKCNDSIGEKRISEWLKKNNISFIQEFTFKNLTGKEGMPLRFDFSILNGDGSIHSLIEFDGRQHFKPIEFFGGEKEFKRRMELDLMKNEYCLINNINLLRIGYTEIDKTEEILSAFVKKSTVE